MAGAGRAAEITLPSSTAMRVLGRTGLEPA
jgi:hypothetical protein